MPAKKTAPHPSATPRVPRRWAREVERVLITDQQIAARVRRLARAIEKDFTGRELVVEQAAAKLDLRALLPIYRDFLFSQLGEDSVLGEDQKLKDTLGWALLPDDETYLSDLPWWKHFPSNSASTRRPAHSVSTRLMPPPCKLPARIRSSSAGCRTGGSNYPGRTH